MSVPLPPWGRAKAATGARGMWGRLHDVRDTGVHSKITVRQPQWTQFATATVFPGHCGGVLSYGIAALDEHGHRHDLPPWSNTIGAASGPRKAPCRGLVVVAGESCVSAGRGSDAVYPALQSDRSIRRKGL